MDLFLSAYEHMQLIAEAMNADDLAAIMTILGPRLGFEFFAITHHGDHRCERGGATIHLHNYPAQWADFYAARALGVSDPVHRASHMTTQGFLWKRIPEFITLTAKDRHVLNMGRESGIGDGFTVPASLLGEEQGSCSF
jgi:LuxR family quorum-sensing system transcriptional regulator CciR